MSDDQLLSVRPGPAKLVDCPPRACIQIKRILHARLRLTYQSKSGAGSRPACRAAAAAAAAQTTASTTDDDDNHDEMASGNRP